MIPDSRINRGLPVKTILHIKKALRATDLQIAALLNISPYRLRRIKAENKRLAVPESEILRRIARILALACLLFDNIDEARKWLIEPQFTLDMGIPLRLMETESGAIEDENALGRLVFWVTS